MIYVHEARIHTRRWRHEDQAAPHFRPGAKVPLLEDAGQSNDRRAIQALTCPKAAGSRGRNPTAAEDMSGSRLSAVFGLVENFQSIPRRLPELRGVGTPIAA